MILRSDRPHEVGFRVGAAEGSARMDSCVLSATMGNYGRLRRLWLRGEFDDSRKAWPAPRFDRLNFAELATHPGGGAGPKARKVTSALVVHCS